MDRNTFAKHFAVSRETMDDLDFLCSELERWNKKINLVSPTTIANAWSRHIVDSAQLHMCIENDVQEVCDMGSGGGFPALVLAILSKELSPKRTFTMIESDQRKCAFLRHVSRETNLNTSIQNMRLEEADIKIFQVITARALASIDKLLNFSERFSDKNTKCLFLKGKDHIFELEDAQTRWNFDQTIIPSITNPESAIVEIRNFERV